MKQTNEVRKEKENREGEVRNIEKQQKYKENRS
jgi:hypothetical protein